MDKNLLTFIIPIYHPSISVDDIFKNIIKQKDQNFNAIVCIDKPTEAQLESIYQLTTMLKDRLKLIINTSHINIVKVLRQALAMSNTLYSYILYSYSYIKSEFTLNLFDFLNKSEIKPDFIEFNGYMRGVNHIDFYRSKYKEEEIYDLSKDQSPIAMVSPYIFNSIIKTEILKDVFATCKIKDANMQLSSDIKYLSLLKSKTFAYIKRTWIEDFNYQLGLLNPKNIQSEWEIIKDIAKDKFVEELQFAYKMHIYYFTAGFLGQLKFKKNSREAKMLKNFNLELEQMIKLSNQQTPNILESNKYFKMFNVVLPTLSELETNQNWRKIMKNFKW